MATANKYASGARSVAICDRHGGKVPYQDLKLEWTGMRVCSECWEPRHPQLSPEIKVDAQALRNPRPDTDDMGAQPADLEDTFPHTAGGPRG